MMVQISETVMINPKRVSCLESVKTKTGYKVIIHVDGERFESSIPFDDLMKAFKDVEENKQYFAL